MLKSFDFSGNRLETATKKGDYEYWLTQEDIADIARIEYASYRPSNTAHSYRAFDIVGSPRHLLNWLSTFIEKINQVEYARLSLIINRDQLHWVTLVLTSHSKKVEAYYLDTLGENLPENYQKVLDSISPLSYINLSGYYSSQKDNYNCGLWALENTEDLTCMVDEGKGLLWLSQRLQRPRSMNYFTRRRLLLALKLESDLIRKARVVPLEHEFTPPEQEADALFPISGSAGESVDESPSKKQKLSPEEKTRELFEFFVKKFIQDFVKRLGIHSVIAKGERLTTEVLKAELQTGFTGALLGVAIARNIVGSIPSLLASLRTISSKYYVNKKKSQKITRAFSELKSDSLSELLTVAAVEIFQSYEQQFMQITDKAGHKIAIEKLAEDAAGRALNYLNEELAARSISSELIAFGILSGKSETYFDPSLKKVRVRVAGSRIQDMEGNSLSTASLFDQVGLVVKHKNAIPDTFYKKDAPQSTRFGYRRLLSWEKNSESEFKESYRSSYIPDNPTHLKIYAYQLNSDNTQQEVAQLIQKLSTSQSPPMRQASSPKNILFNLRRPIKNFSGRTHVLFTLHQLLGLAAKTAVITHKIAQLSLEPALPSLQESIQATVSGMGGIGKTQLALEYARQYAAAYDYNVLWIEAEKKSDMVDSFKKLAVKLAIDLNDAYANEKESNQLVEEIYAYFGNAKSLFIFDNVENAKEVEDILPKVSNGNCPTILITSRYSNWKNVATLLVLDVFSETESTDFIKTELALTGDQGESSAKDLAKLLQNLPLALQQAVAYIKNERNINNEFNIQHYIDRFKQKGQELLAFNFYSCCNDNYSKSVFTTWKVTLERLTQEKIIGTKAIEVLQIMAYLYPDNINNQFFFPLQGKEYLSAAIQLLKNYSLINEGSESHISTIHRLMQRVLRINLEKNLSEFETTVQTIIYLTKDFVSNKEIMSHYYHFLLHMAQHKELTKGLYLKATHKKILEVVTNFEGDKALLFDLLDSAQFTLTRVEYLGFIGEALVVYLRYPFIIALMNVMDYIEKNVNDRQISLEEAEYILNVRKTPKASEIFKATRLSADPVNNARQRNAIRLIIQFEKKLLSPERKIICRRNKKRSASSFCSYTEHEQLDIRQLKAYVKKIGLAARLANFGLLSKDILSALIQGDFESVAISFMLLSSSRVLGKISNKLLIQGIEQQALGDEELFIQKELDYDAKLASHLFLDKEIMLAGRRRFWGNTMKAAAPFVARGTTLFFAYNFVKGLGNKQADCLDNLVNGGIVAIDVGEASVEAAEYLGYIAGVSEVTGPIGESLSLFAIGGMQLYHVNQELNLIEKWVHLSSREKFVEGMRAFFNFQPSQYLEVKANNNQLANKAIDFLKLHPDIQRYVFSAWVPPTRSAKKGFIFLDNKRNLSVVSNNIPEEPNEGHFFCLAGIPSRAHPSSMSLVDGLEFFVESIFESVLGLEERVLNLCINTIGVEYTTHRSGNVTLVALQGSAKVIGPHSDAVFLINDGDQDYQAGDANNLFILQGKHFTGGLQGGLGVNIVKLLDYQPASEYVLLDSEGFLCGKNVTISGKGEFCIEGFHLSNITQLYGRNNQPDTVFPTTGVTVVDTYAGESLTKPDYIYITQKSSKILGIVVRHNTIVRLRPRDTTDNVVFYKIPGEQVGSAFLQIPCNDRTIHRFYFDSPLDALEALSINNDTISFQLSYLNRYFNLNIQHIKTPSCPNNTSFIEKSFIQNALYLFYKSLEVRLVNKKTLYLQWYGNNSIDNIIQFAAPIAHRIDKTLLIQTPQNETIAIGGKQQKILSTDSLTINHLVGSGSDTLYVIQVPKESGVDPFPLKDISLYSLASNRLIINAARDTLDLRELVKKAQSQCSAQNIFPIINENKADLILTLYANYYFSASGCIPLAQNTYPLLKILLKNTLSNYWYQDLDIILDQHPMVIIFEENCWKLVPIPITFTANKNIIVITNKDIKQHDELFILKNIGEYKFIKHNNTDLLLSNIFNNPTKAELYTVLFSRFFKSPLLQKKILSLRLSFLDESLILSEQAQKINNATDFERQIQWYFNTTHVFLNESNRFFNPTNSFIVPGQQRVRRGIAIPSVGSGSSRVIPGICTLFTYISLKELQPFYYRLSSFISSYNGFSLNYQAKTRIASKRNKLSMIPLKKEKNSLVHCRKNIFTTMDCIKNQSSLGLLGYCAHSKQRIAWFISNTGEATKPTFSWFATTDSNISASINDNLNTQASGFRPSNSFYLHHRDGCSQAINFDNINNTALASLFPYLPEEGKLWLLVQWDHEKKMQNKIQQDEMIVDLFKQLLLPIGLNYIGNVSLVYTFIGDYFQAMGLKPNWQEYDPSYFLARWLIAIQQLRLGDGKSNQTPIAAALLLETALLHPWLQQAYCLFLPNVKSGAKKQVLRFCADLLQWGGLDFALIPNLLEMLFSNYLSIAPITLGLRAALSFYMLYNEPSYYYLGIILFFLPQLPSLLEHVGVPVTIYVSKMLEKLAQLFIFQSLLELIKPIPDESRLVQHHFELQAAKQRTAQGRARTSAALELLSSLFRPAPKSCCSQEKSEQKALFFERNAAHF